MELPESAHWHPLTAAKMYRQLAEEATGRYHDAFEQYGRLRDQYRAKELASDQLTERLRTSAAIDYTWGQTDTAKACVSDLNTYSVAAQTYAAMASAKTLEYLARRELGRENNG